MRLLRPLPTRSRRRLLGVTVGLPLLVAGMLTSPAQAAPADQPPARQVSVESSKPNVHTEIDPSTGQTTVSVSYTVTFTNNTDTDGKTSNLVLRPQTPAGMTLQNVWQGDGFPRWVSQDDFEIRPDGSISLPAQDSLPARSSTTMSFTSVYKVNTDTITEEDWLTLSSCTSSDHSKGLNLFVDVADNDDDTKAATYSACTTVTRPRN